MRERRAVLRRLAAVDHGGERLVLDRHQPGRVLGDMARLGDRDGDPLADIAHLLPGQRVLGGGLEKDRRRVGLNHRAVAVFRREVI